MMNRILILILFIGYFQSCIFAQDTIIDTQSGKRTGIKQDKRFYSLNQFGRESLLFLKQPTKWKSSDWLKLCIVSVGTISSMSLDQTMVNLTQGDQKYYYSVGVVGGRVYGEWYSIGAVAGAFGTYGLLARDTNAKKISLELIQTVIYAEAITNLLKIAIGRARPYNSEHPFLFHPFTFFDDGFHSLPSGHATSAMALSTVMSRHAPSTTLKILAYVPAGFTLFSRIYQDKHHLSDEILGAAIGYFVGNWVVDLHEGKKHRMNVTSLYPFTSITYSLNQVPVRKKLSESRSSFSGS